MKKILILIACVFLVLSVFSQKKEEAKTEEYETIAIIRIPWGPIYRSTIAAPQITAQQTGDAIEFSLNETVGEVQVVIYDYSGTKVQSADYNVTANATYSTSIASLLPGRYVIYLFLSEYNPSEFRGCFEVK